METGKLGKCSLVPVTNHEVDNDSLGKGSANTGDQDRDVRFIQASGEPTWS